MPACRMSMARSTPIGRCTRRSVPPARYTARAPSSRFSLTASSTDEGRQYSFKFFTLQLFHTLPESRGLLPRICSQLLFVHAEELSVSHHPSTADHNTFYMFGSQAKHPMPGNVVRGELGGWVVVQHHQIGQRTSFNSS